MTTRKKKADVIMSADLAEMKNISTGSWPKITQGTHLTVKTFEDGHTELVWDDDILLNEVIAAINSIEDNSTVTATKAKLKKVKETK